MIEQRVKRNKKNKISKTLIISILFFIAVIGYFFYHKIFVSFPNDIIVENDTEIIINPGDTFVGLPTVLSKYDIDINTLYYKIYLKTTPLDFPLQAGKYLLLHNSNIGSLIEALRTPIQNELTVILLEGWTIYDIDDYLANKNIIKKGEYIKTVENYNKSTYPFLEEALTLEGFLYPDTYRIDINNFTPEKLIEKQLDTFKLKVYDTLLDKKTGKEIIDIINLASIVEKEEKNPKEKQTVAGILKKRLDENWYIGADITVCYPYKITSKECTPNFIVKNITDKNEYNTRTMLGLPKTPIGNPSAETVEATINYKDTPYYYYLHDSSGTIHYGTNETEHTINKNKYLR